MLFLKFAFSTECLKLNVFLSKPEKGIDRIYIVIILKLIMAYKGNTNEYLHNFAKEVWEIQNTSEMKFILT